MSLTLFLGHGKTEMRGGPAIFMSLYNQWKQGDLRELTAKCMEVYENYSTNFKSLSIKSYNYSLSHSYINGINNIIENIEKINKIKD